MPSNFISDTFETIKGAFAGQIVNNRLNPVHHSIATTGYRIQPTTLHIPDRYGFFSPGPARLQVWEAMSFIYVGFQCCIGIASDILIVFLARLFGLSNSLKAGAVILSVSLVQSAVVWVSVYCDRRRAPGYEWDDWKLRKD